MPRLFACFKSTETKNKKKPKQKQLEVNEDLPTLVSKAMNLLIELNGSVANVDKNESIKIKRYIDDTTKQLEQYPKMVGNTNDCITEAILIAKLQEIISDGQALIVNNTENAKLKM